MKPIVTGLGFAFFFWIGATVTPIWDTSWLLGLSKTEALVLAMFFLLGIYVGTLQDMILSLAKSHDELAARVNGREK